MSKSNIRVKNIAAGMQPNMKGAHCFRRSILIRSVGNYHKASIRLFTNRFDMDIRVFLFPNNSPTDADPAIWIEQQANPKKCAIRRQGRQVADKCQEKLGISAASGKSRGVFPIYRDDRSRVG